MRLKYHRGKIRRPDVAPIHRKRNKQYKRLAPNWAAPRIENRVSLLYIVVSWFFDDFILIVYVCQDKVELKINANLDRHIGKESHMEQNSRLWNVDTQPRQKNSKQRLENKKFQ